MSAERSERRANDREKRSQDLAEALRTNLRKRRDQARARATQRAGDEQSPRPTIEEE